MESKESLSQFLANLNILYGNLLEFYNKFAEAINSNAETVTARQISNEGTVSEIDIPSIGYYTTQVRALAQQIDAMLYANNNEIALQFQDGSVKKFEMQQLSQLVQTLESIDGTSFTVPTDFRTKTNWFFESFLNPLMFVSINVEPLLGNADIKKFSVRRVILITTDDSQNNFFDQTIKGRSDLKMDDLIVALNNEGIQYHVDDNIVDLPVSINRFRGEFTVVSIVQENVATVTASTGITGQAGVAGAQGAIGRSGVTGTVVRTGSSGPSALVAQIATSGVSGVTTGVTTQMVYKLDTLNYYDLINGTQSIVTLAKGDTLVTADDTEYEIVSINKSNNTVILTKKFGIGVINVGVNQLRIRPLAYKVPELQISVGYNERQVVFVSPISSKLDMSTDKWSNGFAIYTNDLNVVLSDGTVLDMATYYSNFVSDFGMMFLSYAKDKQVPASLAITPDSPTLNTNNFKVLNINTHIKEDKSTLTLKAQISAKDKLQNQLDEINKAISDLKAKLNDSTTINDTEKLKIKKSIDQNLTQKDSYLKQLSAIIQQITLGIQTQSTFTANAKYRVRGFWDIPEPKQAQHGLQSVVQFKIMYRYLSKKGNATNVDQIKFTGNTGQEKYGFFSNWNEQVTKIRLKKYDVSKGVYVWADENVQDPDAVNINQVDIPINKGEAVEIRVKSVSEAGFPINPAESDWSTSVIIPFPDDLEVVTDDALLAESNLLDNAIVKFQQELDARGLDVHLLNSLYTGDKYVAHKAEDVASGYYTPEGKIKDVFMVLKEITTQITAIQNSLQSDYGTISVSITDPLGNVIHVQNGSTAQLFAGYYKDLNTDSNNAIQHGEVVTTTYIVSIQNASSTTLELASRIIGGIDERVPSDDDPNHEDAYLAYPTWIGGDTDYTRTRVYDKVPLSITAASNRIIGDFKQESPYQSNQVCGQFIYGRYREYGLLNQLYFDDTYSGKLAKGLYSTVPGSGILGNTAPYVYSYTYSGKRFVTANLYGETPSNGYMYFPYMYPSTGSGSNTPYGTQHPEVWNGNGTSGNGNISEFCLHIEHPAILEGLTIDQMCRPSMPTDEQKYVRVGHAVHFNTTVDEKTDIFGAKYFQQCKYRKPVTYTGGSGGTTQHYNYPIKMGFSIEDTYLIGKYTCGSYLFLAPNTYETLVVDGNHPKYAKKDVAPIGATGTTGVAGSAGAAGPAGSQGQGGVRTQTGINIPIVFQFRCSDKLGYIGGYRKTGDLQNVKYTKKIGIDIYERDMTKKSVALFGDIFSFDVEVSCQYAKTTNIITPITMPQGSLGQIGYK